MRVNRAVIVLCLMALLGACTAAPQGNTPTAGKLKVVATFSVLGDFVRNVAGDHVQLMVLVGPDGDTHEYEPSPSESVALANADVVIENGLGFEPWLDNLYTAAHSTAKRIVASRGVATLEVKDEPAADAHSETDPHIWQDVQRAMSMVRNIEAGLSEADPTNAAIYKQNAEAYLHRLETLDNQIVQQVAGLPATRRKLVTSHDALGYYAARYGFELVGSVIASVSTEAGEPSAKDFADLINAIRASGTQAIFLETVTSPALIERISKEADVKIGPALYTDALGAPDSDGATYIDAMRHNTQAIVSTLR